MDEKEVDEKRVVGEVETRIAYMWIAISFLQRFRIPTLSLDVTTRALSLLCVRNCDGSKR
jgi:hypothetical protein